VGHAWEGQKYDCVLQGRPSHEAEIFMISILGGNLEI